MNPMKQLQVVVLLVIAAALLGGARADAASWTALTPTGEEPGASGDYCVQHMVWAGANYYGDVAVRCTGLTPGATYHAVVWDLDPWAGFIPVGEASFATTKRGTGRVTVADVPFLMLGPFHVEVCNARDVVVLTSQY